MVDLRHLNRYGHVLIKDLVASFTQRQICEVLQGDLDSSPGTVDSPWKPSLDGVLPGDETLEYLPRVGTWHLGSSCALKDPIAPSFSEIRLANSTWTDENLLPVNEVCNSSTYADSCRRMVMFRPF